MANATIILLNGASSSGKSSIAAVLQERLEEPFLLAGVDHFRPLIPERYFAAPGRIAMDPPEGALARQACYLKTIREGEHVWYELHLGPIVRRLTVGRHAAIAALASAGNNLIVDEVLYEPEFVKRYARALRGHNVLFVGLRCPLEILEQRERDRGDRLIGYVRGHFHRLPAHGSYDVEVDTAVSSPEECAEQILRRLQNGPPDAFERLREMFDGRD